VHFSYQRYVANRIREQFKGNKVHLCSIVNAKAGGCSENCSFCAQSSFYQTGSPRYGFVDPEPVQDAAEEANQNGVTAVGLVAAWKGLNEGPMLDEVCDRIRELKASGKTRPDASLGIIKNQKVADRLKGLECYGHNLESSRRFFPTCTTHTYDDRIETIGHFGKAGIKICSGGIIGIEETREDRCDLAFSLKEIGATQPITILNPIPGTPFERTNRCRVWNFEDHRLLPFHSTSEIAIAGGRTANLRDAQSINLWPPARSWSATTYHAQPARRKDLQMLKDLGLIRADNHGFSDQQECGCGQTPETTCAAH
jgi:biotin synthase